MSIEAKDFLAAAVQFGDIAELMKELSLTDAPVLEQLEEIDFTGVAQCFYAANAQARVNAELLTLLERVGAWDAIDDKPYTDWDGFHAIMQDIGRAIAKARGV